VIRSMSSTIPLSSLETCGANDQGISQRNAKVGEGREEGERLGKRDLQT
jgi:hypothetical protein